MFATTDSISISNQKQNGGEGGLQQAESRSPPENVGITTPARLFHPFRLPAISLPRSTAKTPWDISSGALPRTG